MIKVKVLPDQITLKGHAMYEDYGKDIVCAAVSSITTTTINACISLDKDSIEYKQGSDELIINIKNKDKNTLKLIDNMISMLKELEQSYPKNINIK